jgi:hypothetical protein
LTCRFILVTRVLGFDKRPDGGPQWWYTAILLWQLTH